MAWVAAIVILSVGLLFLFNRRAAYVALAAVAIIGGIVALATALQPSTAQSTKEAVTASATVNADDCPDVAKPIRIEFHNGNERAVQKTSFGLVGRLNGHSSIAYRGFLRDDRIIEPGKSLSACYGLLPLGFAPPRPEKIDPRQYEWSVDISLVDFTNP